MNPYSLVQRKMPERSVPPSGGLRARLLGRRFRVRGIGENRVDQLLEAVERSVLQKLAVDEHGWRAAHAGALRQLHVRLNRRLDLLRLEVGLELRHVEAELAGVGVDLLGGELALIGEQQIVHLPE